MDIRHIFILNPAAGLADGTDALAARIEGIAQRRGLVYEIHRTAHAGHAPVLVRALARQHAPATCRFYACGGDGTLSEVATGAAEFANAQVACYPCGTGNDFIRIFAGREHFKSLEDQIDGACMQLDLMHVGDGAVSVNLCSAGFDARVAHWMGKNKRRLPFGGSFPYKMAVLVNFFRQIWRHYRIEIDGQSYEGEYSIIVAALGRYYGGGFYAVPEAEPDDGLLDFLLVRRVSRMGLIAAIGKYAAGRHRELGHIAFYTRGRCMTIESDAPEPINIDGEIRVCKRMQFGVARERLTFVVPQGAALIRNGCEETEQFEGIERLRQ